MKNWFLVSLVIGLVVISFAVIAFVIGGCEDAQNFPEVTTTTTIATSTTTTTAPGATTTTTAATTTTTTTTTTLPKASAPTFTASGGTYEANTMLVTIEAPAADAVYYTTNGLTPTTASTLYTDPVSIEVSTTIKAIATKAGHQNSDVAANYYELWWWQPMGGGMNDAVNDLANGSLYAGGTFTSPSNYLAKWDGASWSSLGTETGGINPNVFSLYYFDNFLCAGGGFTEAGGVTVNYVAKWDVINLTWEAFGSGTDGWVRAFAHDDTYLYIVGTFSNASGVPDTAQIARWHMTNLTWEAMGSGTGSNTICLLRAGDHLYAGGEFTQVSGVPGTSNIARWHITDGTWEALGSGATLNGVFEMCLDGNYIYANADCQVEYY
jgi:hypothetical protein